MAYQEFDVNLKEETFFNTLTFLVNTPDILEYINTSFERILDQYSISKDDIKSIHIEKVEKNHNQLLFVTIHYSTLDTLELKNMNEEDKIRTVLQHMGYENTAIKSITYNRKSKFNLSEFIWCIRLYDENYDFAPDESFSARDYEIHMHQKLREILGFDVEVNFI